MPDNKLNKLHSLLVSKGIDNKSFEEFEQNFSNDEVKQKKLHDLLRSKGIDNKSFKEFQNNFFQKKNSLVTSQEGVMESTTGEDTTTTSSGSSEDVADDMIGGSDDTISVSELVDKTEGEAIPYLRRELADNGFSLEETGMFGNAILVTDNITGEETEIDLKPIEFFGASKEDQIKKIQELRKQKTDPKRRFLSDINQLDDIKREDEGKLNAILSVGNSVPGVEVEYGAFGEVTISKNGNSVTVNTEDRSTSGSQMMAQINKFLYDNLTEEEALEATQENTRQIIEDINEKAKKELKIDVSDEAVDAEFYGKDYFKNLFKFAESSDVEINIDEDEKKRLEEGVLKVISASYGEDKEFFNKESISNDIEKILENNPEAKELVEKYNAVERAKTIDSKIKRAKKLAKERVLEQHPRREQVKRVVDRKYDNLNESAKNTATTMEMAVTNYNNYLKDVVAPDLKKMMESDPELQVVVEQDDQGIVTGVMYNKETPELNKLIENVKNESNDLERLILKSDADLIKANAEMESVEGWIDATKRNYNIVDNAYIDLKNNTKEIFRSFVTNISLAQEAVGISGPMGMSQEDFRAGLRAEQEKDAELQQNYFETMRDYKEAYEEGSFGRFAFRQFSGEVPNMGLAIGMAYGGGAIGLSRATISTLTSTAFGLSAMGSKYNETTKRQEMAQKAEAALAELESVKDFMPKDDYYNRKYELERAKEDLDISSTDKTLAVVGSGLIEFGVSKFIGTVPNAAKIRSDFFKPAKYLDDINRSNVRAVLDSGWEITKRTAGGVIEETSIELLNQFNNYAFLGDDMDLSQLDDVAVTSIITEGAMNVPSVAYSTLISQTNINRYKQDVEGIVSQITNLKEALNDDSMPQGVRSIIHSDITSKIKQLSGITSNMEADALLLGADNLKNLLMLSGMEKSLFDQAGVESDDNYEAINLKVKNHLKTLDKSEAKKYQDKINYISKQRKEITGNLNYEGAIEKVFGDKGTKTAETLDDSLTAKEKYVEVYKQLREDVNKAAKKEHDAIQKQETRDIPQTERTEGVQEVEEEVREPFVTEKKKEKVSDALNRPVTLTELGGSKLDAPIEGDLYVEGQQVVVEDSDGNITEIGNVDEISDSTLEDLGIVPQESDVKTDNEGNLVVNGETLVPNRKGIKKDKRGNISRVVLRSPDGSITRTLRGANAEDAAYQILLKEAQSPEQSERVNQLLEQDEEFQNELRQTTESTETQADTDTREASGTEVNEVISSEYASSEIERVKELPTESEDGATMNLDGSKYEDGGLVIPVASVNMKVSELTVEAIEKFIKENSDSIGADNIKVGIYKFPNSDNASIDINIVADRSMRDEALKIGKELGQESLFDLDTFENIKTGADGKNPKTLTSQDFLDIQSRLTKKDGVSKLRDAFSKKPSTRKQTSDRPSIKEVVDKAYELNISNIETNKYLSEIGYTKDQIAEFREKQEDIYKKSGNIVLDWVNKTRRYLTSAKGFLPKSVFIARENKDAAIDVEIGVAERAAKRLNKALKGKPDSVYEEVNNLMRGEKFNLPRDIAMLAKEMRLHIDSLSEKLIESGAIKSSESKENIRKNLGSYLNRSFKLFDDKDWSKKVPEKTINQAREYIKNSWYQTEYKFESAKKQAEENNMTVDEWIDQKSSQEVEEILKKEDANSFITAAIDGSKNMKVLRQRKDIPAEIRALMGEYNDPAYNYVISVAKIINIIENQKYLEKIKDIGEGVFLFKEEQLKRGDAKDYVRISAESNESLAPLNGYFAPKEFVNQMRGTDLLTIKNSWFKIIYNGWLKTVGLVKKMKTILSIGTHGKNVFGNGRFMAQNGYLNPKDYTKAFKLLRNEFKTSSDEAISRKLDEYKKVGIIGQSVQLSEIKSMFKDGDSFDVRIEKRITEQTESKFKNAVRIGRKGAKNVDNFLQDLYQAEDDLFKIVAYENEKRDYADIMFDKKYDELNDNEKRQVDDKVSNIVKNITPNYGRVGGLAKGLKAVPVAGTFISFQLESYRTAWNTVALALNEIKSNNPKLKAKGSKRLASLILVEGIKQSLLYFLGTTFLGDDEEEDIKANDVRPFLPEWAKNSDIIVTENKPGEFTYLNLSASDPFGSISQIINAGIRGESFSDSVIGMMKEFADPVTSQDILLSAIDDVLRNQNSYGGKLYENTDTFFDKSEKTVSRIYKALEPGTLTSIRKIAKKESMSDMMYETVGQFTGLKPIEVDVKKVLNYKIDDIKRDISSIKSEKYRAEYKAMEEGSLDGLFEAYNNVDEKLKPVFEEANKITNKAMRLGVSIMEIDNILSSKRISNDDASMILFYDNLKGSL